MMYVECAKCGRYSDDGEIIDKEINGKVKRIHLCPCCWDIDDNEVAEIFEKIADKEFGVATNSGFNF